MKHSLFAFATILITGCLADKSDSSKLEIGEQEAILILDIIEIPRNEDYYIHVIVDEYLNDSSVLVHVEQHAIKKEIIEYKSDFIFEGMQVFLHQDSKSIMSWIPDSYYKRLLIRKYNDVLTIDLLGAIPFQVLPEGGEVDSTFQMIDEDDFM